LEGVPTLPDNYKTVVIETLEKGGVIAPPDLELPPAKPKTEEDESEAEEPKPKRKSRAKGKKKAEATDEDDVDGNDVEKCKSKSKPKAKPKAKGKKRSSEELDEDSEPEYLPKKTRSRATPMEEVVDPTVARVQAMAEGLRTEAGK
jgi:hypothetical protein